MDLNYGLLKGWDLITPRFHGHIFFCVLPSAIFGQSTAEKKRRKEKWKNENFHLFMENTQMVKLC